MDGLTPWALEEGKRFESRFSQYPNHHSLWRRPRKKTLIRACLFVLPIAVIRCLTCNTTFWPRPHTKIDYQTKPEEQCKAVLPDEAIWHLNTATYMNIDYSADFQKIKLFNGEVLIEVVQLLGTPFVVDVGGHSAVLVGGFFNLQLRNAVASLSVIEGQIEVHREGTSNVKTLAEPSPERHRGIF